MNTIAYLEEAKAVFRAAPLLSRIHCEEEYQDALAIVDELIDDFDNNVALIDRLTDAIEEWENASETFAEFNAGVRSQDAVDMLRFLMDQHGLGIATCPKSAASPWSPELSTAKGATSPAAISKPSPGASG